METRAKERFCSTFALSCALLLGYKYIPKNCVCKFIDCEPGHQENYISSPLNILGKHITQAHPCVSLGTRREWQIKP